MTGLRVWVLVWVVNGKCETLRDGEKGVLAREPETFWIFESLV